MNVGKEVVAITGIGQFKKLENIKEMNVPQIQH